VYSLVPFWKKRRKEKAESTAKPSSPSSSSLPAPPHPISETDYVQAKKRKAEAEFWIKLYQRALLDVTCSRGKESEIPSDIAPIISSKLLGFIERWKKELDRHQAIIDAYEAKRRYEEAVRKLSQYVQVDLEPPTPQKATVSAPARKPPRARKKPSDQLDHIAHRLEQLYELLEQIEEEVEGAEES